MKSSQTTIRFNLCKAFHKKIAAAAKEAVVSGNDYVVKAISEYIKTLEKFKTSLKFPARNKSRKFWTFGRFEHVNNNMVCTLQPFTSTKSE